MQYRSTTDEMLAARFDKEPWVAADGSRYGHPRLTGAQLTYAPRPECIPSRDPEPFISTLGTRTSMALEGDKFWRWSPRPEYARPEPNPILVAFRHAPVEFRSDFIEGVLDEDSDWQHLLDAHKVLTRFVNIYKED